jgi:reverse gyrase
MYKAPCEKCLPEEEFSEIIRENDISLIPRIKRLELYAKGLRKPGRITEMLAEEKAVLDFEEFFRRVTNGYSMWSAQRTWARRLLRGESFSIIAPTGTGKTVFSLIAGLYMARKSSSRKIYLVFPTTPLLLQAWSKLLRFAENSGLKPCTLDEWGSKCIRIISIHGKLRKKEKELYIEKVKSGDFDVLLTTSAFMHRHEDLLPRGTYDLVVMDDVDAVLRSARAVRRLLRIIGLNDEDIDKGLELIKARAKLATITGENAEKLKLSIQELEEAVEKAKEKIAGTKLIVNSATGRPRGIYPKLFRVFLNFEAGAKPEAIRNIVDAYTECRGLEEQVSKTIELASKLRDGLLVFVPMDKGVEFAEYLASVLKKTGLNAEAFHAKKQVGLIERFARGEINILVGVASYYGVLVRGLDLPERVKYVLFVGIPRHKFNTRMETIPSPIDIVRMLSVLREVAEGEDKEELSILVGRISRRLRTMTQGAIAALKEEFVKVLNKSREADTPLLQDLYKAFMFLKQQLERPEVIEKLKRLGDIGITIENGEVYILIPDVATYIQASGRCSRLYPGGITKGLSIILVDDERLLRGLVKRIRWIYEGFTVKELSEVDLDSLQREIEEERERVRRIIAGEIQAEKQLDLVKTALLIVESPNKARTIANFFGKPSIRILEGGLRVYEVAIGNYIINIVATGGHIYDLAVDQNPPEKDSLDALYGVLIDRGFNGVKYIPIYTDIKKCPNGHQFTDEDKCPKCGVEVSKSDRKLSIIQALRKIASEVDVVLIGTDPDAEGEKIAWDLSVLLEPYAEKIQRIEFHEVTRRAIINAIFNPRGLAESLVEAQIVRRIEDRWLGFALSGVVQKYAWPLYCLRQFLKGKIHSEKSVEELCCKPNRNMSAGRVQTPVLGFIKQECDKTRKPEYSKYSVNIVLEGGYSLPLLLSYDDALAVFKKLDGRSKVIHPDVEVHVVEKSIVDVNPPPPFTTDTLLAEASRQYGFSTTKTMEVAQNLFEMGFITYHRTDSTRVSDAGIEVARQYLEAKYGSEKLREVFKPRTWGEGGAHEAIRPTRPLDADTLSELVREGAIVVAGRLTRDHFRLYDLIFRRFIASQMNPARVMKVKFEVVFKSNGEQHRLTPVEYVARIIEKGYLELYNNIREEAPWAVNIVEYVKGKIPEGEKPRRIRHPLPRFHDVVKWMKDNGIGRPSTYAKIIQTLIDRYYVKLIKSKNALVVQKKGELVHEFLEKHFKELVSIDTTRELEERMDKIEANQLDYQVVLMEMHREVEDKVFGRIDHIRRYTLKEVNNIVRESEELFSSLNIEKCLKGIED